MTPLVELHCHLDGLLDPAMLSDPGVARLPLDHEGLRRDTPVQGRAAFWRWFEHSRALEGHLARYQPILKLQAQRWIHQGLRYVELMIGSSEIPRDHEEMRAQLGAFRAWLDTLEAGRVQIELLMAFGRDRSPEAVDEIITRALALYEMGLIVGVALAGRELPLRPFDRSLHRLREAGVPLEIHAGEWSGPALVWEALAYQPRRLGHAVGAFEAPWLLEVIKARRVHLELCLTSNLRTGSVADLAAHPVGQARALGLDFSLSTDDPGPFQCTLPGELRRFQATFGASDAEIEAMMRRAWAARFARLDRLGGLASLEAAP
ncbi:hypothetical protein KKF91_21375 [Myxococcota bacterium]|nr:hypothetical protein [Myxococcota bacterium]